MVINLVLRPWSGFLKVFLLCLLIHSLAGNSRISAINRTATTMGGYALVLPGSTFEYPYVPSNPGYVFNPTGNNWSFSGAGLIRSGIGYAAGNGNAPQGSQVAFIQSTGQMTLSLTSVAGDYVFDFYAAQLSAFPTSAQVIQLQVDGAYVQNFQPAGAGYQLMKSVHVSLASGYHTIKLVGLGGSGIDIGLVDNFRATRLIDRSISGFESPAIAGSYQYAPPGGPWSFAGAAGLTKNYSGFTSGNPVAPEGNQVLFLQGGGSASQYVYISKAGFYRLRMKGAHRANTPFGGATKNLRVTFSNVEIGEFRLETPSYTQYATTALYLNPGNHYLTLKGVDPISGDHTGFVDDLRLERIHDWHDSYVWNGGVPNVYDEVTIPNGSVVGMRSTMNSRFMTVNGELVAGQNQNITCNTNRILINGGNAKMEVGQELAPYNYSATFTLNASSGSTSVHGHLAAMGNNFIGAMGGGLLNVHGKEKKSWTTLGANVNAGSSTITLKEAVNWSVGDKIVIVSSRKNWGEAEEKTIAWISGNTIGLTNSLSYPHTGVVKYYSHGGQNWAADIRAEVGLLTHNIKIQGNYPASTNGYGGHIMIMGGSKGNMSGVELYRMGQKGLLGRYPFHWHMLGDVGEGQFFKRSSVHKSFNRALTIHGTNKTLVEDNFFYDHVGHGLFLEDGSELDNIIRRNVVLKTTKPALGDEVIPSDNQFSQVQNRSPASFWITNPQNTFEDNVAAGTEGTGYWFIFPTTPVGPSASVYPAMEPWKLELTSFKRNTAHSCMNGLDIFDRLGLNHEIVANYGWSDPSQHVMDECLWYANDHGVYTGIGGGGPTNNLIFRDNIFLENQTGTMIASYAIVENSIFVANSGQYMVNGERKAYRVYDGAGQVRNCHFEGWNASNANFLQNTGAGTKHPNHIFNNNTVSPATTVRCSLPNFDLPTPTASQLAANATNPGWAYHPRVWSIVLRDVDGSISGVPNSSIIGNHPFTRIGNESQPYNWTNTYVTSRHYALSLLSYDVPRLSTPEITITRTKAGTPTATASYVSKYKEHHQLPFIVNEGFEYRYHYLSLPSIKVIRMKILDADPGDDYMAIFEDFGKLSGGLVTGGGAYYGNGYPALVALRSSNSTGFCLYNDDLYVKPVATNLPQTVTITWTSSGSFRLASDPENVSYTMGNESNPHSTDAAEMTASENIQAPEIAVREDLEVWPNPFEDHLRLQWDASERFERLMLLDMQGRVVRDLKLDIDAHKLTLDFQSEALAKGLYLLQLNGQGEIRQIKVMKQ